MKYIGNKTRLLKFIYESMLDYNIPMSGVFCDIFGGTGSVGSFFKMKGFKIISNDIMTYSYIYQYVNVKMNKCPDFKNVSSNGIQGAVNILNNQVPIKGYVFDNYAPSGLYERQYFSDENAMKIDSVRELIQDWKNNLLIDTDEFYVLLSLLLNSADFVANISGTYGAYLKIWRSMALKPFHIELPVFYDNGLDNEIYQEDANYLVRNITSNILYIDPPYNERQYAPNFHVLENISLWDKPELVGKTGQRDYSSKKSLYCYKKQASCTFRDLIENANTDYIILSYNNEGIIDRKDIVEILSQKGKLKEYKTDYRRFRTEKDNEHRTYKSCDDKVTEHLYIVKVFS